MNNPFRLIQEHRFGPYFVTQFLGALNDNVYRIALMILIATWYNDLDKDKADFLVNLCAGIFILPFFLFSAIAGKIADKFDKALLMRKIKFAEVVIMGLVGLAFYLNSMPFLIVILFLLGSQAAFFGPIKYSILPEHLKPNELVEGNGLVEMGTFIAILLGTIIGSLLMSLHHHAKLAVTLTTLTLALFGWLSSCFIPKAAVSPDHTLKISLEPFSETWKATKMAFSDKATALGVMGISWFWFYGSSFLTQLPNYNTRFLHGNEHVMTLLLVAFSLGIGVGSMLCNKLSKGPLNLKLIPLGALGLTVFALDLGLAQQNVTPDLLTVSAFLQSFDHWRVFLDLTMMGLFGGFYIVPLYVILQQRSKPQERSRIIAANNILNALWMVLASVFAIGAFHLGQTIPQFFLTVACLNALVTLYAFMVYRSL